MSKYVCMIQGGGAGSPALFGLQIIRCCMGKISSCLKFFN